MQHTEVKLAFTSVGLQTSERLTGSDLRLMGTNLCQINAKLQLGKKKIFNWPINATEDLQARWKT